MDQSNGQKCCPSYYKTKNFLVLILVIGAIVLGGLSILRERIVRNNLYQVSFTGQGKVFAKPDIAQITLGVRTDRQSTSVKAVNDNTAKMNKVIEAVKAQGVEDKDVKTTGYNLNPEYDYLSGRSVLAGYGVYQEVTVKIRNLDNVGKVIEASTGAGANQVGNISFTIDDLEAIKKLARNEAIAEAKVKAEEMSKMTGLDLGKLINVYENSYGNQPVPYYAYDTMARGMGGGSSAPEIQTGENEVVLEVTLTFEVK